MTSRVDCCNLAEASKSTTDKLQRVLNAAARVVSDTRKYDRRLSHLLHDELHWLDVPQPVQYKLCATVHPCLQHKAPQYMTAAASTPQTSVFGSICGPPAAISCSYRHTGVRCSVVELFLCPARPPGTRYQTTCHIRHVPFRRDLKTFLFSFTSVQSTLDALRLCAI